LDVLNNSKVEVLLLQIWGVIYRKDNQVKEITKLCNLKARRSIFNQPVSIHLRAFLKVELNSQSSFYEII
jgi:hypothetical protein